MRANILLVCAIFAIDICHAAAAPTASAAKMVEAEFAPQPKYPVWAGLRGAQGRGMFVLRIEIKSGRVRDVVVVQSTGHKDLDAAAVVALKQWRFKRDTLTPRSKTFPNSKDPLAGEVSLIKVPVIFEIRE